MEKGLYAPLAVIESIREGLEPKIPETELANSPSFITDALNWTACPQDEKGSPLNLDEFISWVVGASFMKKSYQGAYSYVNESMLGLMELQRTKQPYKKARDAFRSRILFASVISCFDQQKQAYQFDKDFAEELFATEHVTLPPEIIARLPYRCFYLDVENLSMFGNTAGMFVYAGHGAGETLPNICLIEAVHTQDGIKTHISYISGKEIAGTGMYAGGEVRFQKGDPKFSFHMAGAGRNHGMGIPLCDSPMAMAKKYCFAAQAILYLGSANPDIGKKPKRKYVYTGTRRKMEDGGVPVTEIGIRYGKAIRIAKASGQEGGETEIVMKKDAKPRKPVTSHMRKAHWQHYWVGKGRKERILKWIPPVFVSGTGKELPVTVHKVSR